MNNFNYKGQGKTKNYFEGWYFKISDDKHAYSIIAGISLYTKDPHSFIQIIDSSEKEAYYFRFEVSDFFYNADAIRIKDNILGVHKLKIEIDPFSFNLQIEPTVQLRQGIFSHSAMSYFKCLPMPTYHEIVFLNAKTQGTIKTKNDNFQFNGNGYMEKDYGTCFPKKWLWIQTNNFQNNNASFVLSQANLFGEWIGFFCIFNIDGVELRFATYNGCKINYHCDKQDVKVIIEKDDICLIANATWNDGHSIVAPNRKGKMNKEIEESITSTLEVCLYKNNEIIFHDNAINVGYENQYIGTEQENKKAS